MESVTLVTVDNKIQPLMPQLPPTPGKKSAPEPSLQGKLLAAGLGACMADLVTFPLDTAKVRLQVGHGPMDHSIYLLFLYITVTLGIVQ